MRCVIIAVCLTGLAACGPGSDGAGGARGAQAAALQALSLSTSGAGRVSYARAFGDGDRFILENVVVRMAFDEELEEFRADSLAFQNLDGGADASSFDAMIFENVSFGREEIARADRLVLNRPNRAAIGLVERAFSLNSNDIGLAPLRDYAFESVALEGLTFVEAEQDGEIDIGAMRLEGLSEGVIERMSLEALSSSVQAEEGSFALFIENVTVRGMNIRFLEVAEEPGDLTDVEAFTARMASAGLNDPYVKHYDQFVAQDIGVSLNGVELALARVEAQQEETEAGQLIATNRFGPLTVTADVEGGLTGVQMGMALSFLGFGNGIEISGSSRQVADRAHDRIVVEQNQLTVRDAFTLDMTMDLQGLGTYGEGLEQLAGVGESFDLERHGDVFAPLMLNGFELRLQDQALVQRALDLAAGLTGATPDDMRVAALEIVAAQADGLPQGALRDTAFEGVEAFSSFIAEPGTLVMKLETDGEGVPLADLLTGNGDQVLPLSFANER